MSHAATVFTPVAGELAEVEAHLAALLEADAEAMTALARPTILSGGKRLRPALVLLVGSLGRADPKALLDTACGIELIHAATLIHDDLIDSSPTRRGVPAIHAVAGATAAILAGDHYIAKGLGLLARGAGAEVVEEVAAAVMTICAGELRQSAANLDLNRTVADYRAAIAGKTAALFEAACSAGAAVGGVSADVEAAVRAYGGHAGMAFQIADDLLDYTADAEALGKPVAADLRDGTVTLPLMYALAEPACGPRLRVLLAGAPPGESDYEEIVALVRSSGGVERAGEAAREEADHARAALAPLPPGEVRDALLALAAFVVSRPL